MTEPLVLLHAFPLDHRMWVDQTSFFSAHFPLIVPDLRGFGEAPEELGDHDEIAIDRGADDVAQLLDRRGVEKAVIAGISRGGYIAMAFARRYPERLKALILFDTRATPADEKERSTFSAMAERVRSEGVSFVPEAMKLRLFGSTTLEKRPELVARVNAIILSQRPAAIAAAATGMANRPDARPGLRSIVAPTLAIAGVEDSAFAETEAIAQAIPHARFAAIREAGHLSNMECPGLVSNVIAEFLKTI